MVSFAFYVFTPFSNQYLRDRLNGLRQLLSTSHNKRPISAQSLDYVFRQAVHQHSTICYSCLCGIALATVSI